MAGSMRSLRLCSFVPRYYLVSRFACARFFRLNERGGSDDPGSVSLELEDGCRFDGNLIRRYAVLVCGLAVICIVEVSFAMIFKI